jgi:hypothetical protein
MTLRLRAADAAIPIGAALRYCSRIDGGERARAVTSRLIKHPYCREVACWGLRARCGADSWAACADLVQRPLPVRRRQLLDFLCRDVANGVRSNLSNYCFDNTTVSLAVGYRF